MYIDDIEISDVIYEGRPIREVVSDGRQIWGRDKMTYETFSYAIPTTQRLSDAAPDLWRGVSHGGAYIRLTSMGVHGGNSTNNDGQFQPRAHYRKPIRAYNLEVAAHIREAVTADRNLGVTLGSEGVSYDSPYDFYSLYVRSGNLFVTRGPSSLIGDNTTLYSNTSMGSIPAGSRLKLRREWVNSSTDRLTVILNDVQITSFTTPNLKPMDLQNKDFDTSVNYPGIRSAFHRSLWTNYFAPVIHHFEVRAL